MECKHFFFWTAVLVCEAAWIYIRSLTLLSYLQLRLEINKDLAWIELSLTDNDTTRPTEFEKRVGLKLFLNKFLVFNTESLPTTSKL